MYSPQEDCNSWGKGGLIFVSDTKNQGRGL